MLSPSWSHGLPKPAGLLRVAMRSEEHTSELQSQSNLVCRLLLEKKKNYVSPQNLQCVSPILPHSMTLNSTISSLIWRHLRTLSSATSLPQPQLWHLHMPHVDRT